MLAYVDGTADAVFLQRLDQARFGKPRRRFGEVLIGGNIGKRHGFADLHRGQFTVLVVVLGVFLVAPFFVDGEKSRIHHRGSAGAEERVAARIEIDGHGVQCRELHLAGNGAFPDQVIQLALIVVEKNGDAGRRVQCRCRTNRFMRFLRVLGFRAIEIRIFRQRFRTEISHDDFPHVADRITGEIHGIRSHVGDQTDRTFVAECHAFIQALRDAHRAAR